jgi:hypothetical protein
MNAGHLQMTRNKQGSRVVSSAELPPACLEDVDTMVNTAPVINSWDILQMRYLQIQFPHPRTPFIVHFLQHFLLKPPLLAPQMEFS